MVENIRIIIGLHFEDKEKNIAFAKAKSVLKIHPTAKIDMGCSRSLNYFGVQSPLIERELLLPYLFYVAQHSETDQNQIEEVNFLLNHLDDAKYAKNGEYGGRTPLYESALSGNVILTKIFLKYNPTWAKVNVKWTIMHRIPQ